MSTLNKEAHSIGEGLSKGKYGRGSHYGTGHIGGLLSYGERRVGVGRDPLVRDGLG